MPKVETLCDAVELQQCSTSYERQCSKNNERQGSTRTKQQCSTVFEQECTTEYDRQYSATCEHQCSTSYNQLTLLAVEKTRMAGLGMVDLLVHVDRNILLATWTDPSDRPGAKKSSRTLWSQCPCCPTTVFQATFAIHHFTNIF